MDIEKILSDLRSERDRLNQAITALELLGSDGATLGQVSAAAITSARRRGVRSMSAAARRRIAEAMKKRWAQRKASGAAPRGKSAPKGRGGKPRISAAGLKRISEAAKKRWAKIKAAKAPARRGMSAAARKRLSLLAKQRWAQRKKAQKA
jgi:hypothetical protein